MSRTLGDYFECRQERGRPGLPIMSVTMNDGLIPREDIDRRTESALTPAEHLLVQPGDIAYNMMRMWQGACGLAQSEAVVSPAYIVLKPRPTIDPAFAFHWFKTPHLIHLFWAYSHGLTEDRLRLYFDDFCQIPAAAPSLAEQRRIATALDIWDRAIETTMRLIAAKRRRKAGIAGQVLFDEDAPRGFIRDIAEVNPRTRIVDATTMVSFVGMEDVSETGELLRTTPRRRSELGTGYTLFVDGDVLVAKITPCFENGKGALASGLVGGVGLGSTEFHVVRPHDPADAEFLHQITKLASFRVAGERQMTGSAGQQRVPAEFIEDFPVHLPGSNARRAAGSLLADLDRELADQERKLDLLRTQKRGLAQSLLTDPSQLDQRFDTPASSLSDTQP